MRKDLLIFDLDGTLIDSSVDIAIAANKTLLCYGYRTLDIERVKESIGWGVKMLLKALMPEEPPDRIEEARVKFLEFYGSALTANTVLYPGVRETIGYYEERGKKMAVVTNKPIALAERILDEFGILKSFALVIGGDSLNTRKPDPGPLEKVMSTLGSVPAASVMVGDSPIDCEAGRTAGVLTIGVAYGFRPLKELEDAGFDFIVNRFSSLKDLIE